ncbi:hypothetical protein BDQ12DRAFT_100722 [Crucibulum laeve]|uniref:Uncharacterized protein n=1 Tax=Crucibulum laeve TaxID=68775 RepID=A0A5C3M0R0_9AGAR|nr:hypothetical protein BDQ12DRAFT_100722 [Crucibulum laeve]
MLLLCGLLWAYPLFDILVIVHHVIIRTSLYYSSVVLNSINLFKSFQLCWHLVLQPQCSSFIYSAYATLLF